MSSTHPIPSPQLGSSCVAGTWTGNSISPEGPLSSKAVGDEREEGSGVASTPRSPPKALLQPPPPRQEPAPCKRYRNGFRWQRATISRQCEVTNYKSHVQTSRPNSNWDHQGQKARQSPRFQRRGAGHTPGRSWRETDALLALRAINSTTRRAFP